MVSSKTWNKRAEYTWQKKHKKKQIKTVVHILSKQANNRWDIKAFFL
jgi:Ser-tRNA(Ala) deacylase AlaX